MLKDGNRNILKCSILLTFVAILNTTIVVFAQRGSSEADATADFKFPPPNKIMYAKAENPSGRLTAYAYELETIAGHHERAVMVMNASRDFQSDQGRTLARFHGQPIIDFEWQTDFFLRVFVLCTKCNDEMKWLLDRKFGGVRLEYEFIEERGRAETKRSISPDPPPEADTLHTGFVAVSVERVFAEPLETITQILMTAEYPDTSLPSERLPLNPDIKPVLSTVKGSADISFEWRGASQLVITMDSDKENDVLHMRDEILDLEIRYEFRE